MTSSAPLYALPLPTSSVTTTAASSRQRKRKHASNRLSTETTSSDQSSPAKDVEYKAVVTPEERFQCRLAGLTLDQPPPAFPFPHAHSREEQPIVDDVQPYTSLKLQPLLATHSQPTSLRLQHLSALTTILHTSLQRNDYPCARRALALLLRTEIHGRTIDIRHGGLWGVAAELLARTQVDAISPHSGGRRAISRPGFERAKIFYDKIALQYPWHRTHPTAVNAQDFKLAMLNLWVYVTVQESGKTQNQIAEHEEVRELDSDQDPDHSEQELQAKRWELSEAERIAREIDALMGTIPFIDDLELIRLRGHVALWAADLVDEVEKLDANMNGGNDASRNGMVEDDMEQMWLSQSGIVKKVDEDGDEPGGVRKVSQKAVEAKNMARRMFEKLGIEEDGSISY